jgi:RNA-binding protein YhbY
MFSGTVQNMHLHWKYRELVKIIVKEEMDEAVRIAKMLENESGGILVDVITVSKGQAIIMYRGKNYERPRDIKPRHLLTKREALKLSLELQRKKVLCSSPSFKKAHVKETPQFSTWVENFNHLSSLCIC